MIRNRQLFAFTMAAALAVALTAASAGPAQAQGELTSDGPVTLIGAETEGHGIKTRGPNSWTAFGFSTECDGRDYVAHELNQTPHELIPPNGSTSITLSPRFEVTCYTNQAAPTSTKNHESIGVLPVTVTMNGCDYVLHIGDTVEEANTYEVTTDIVCPEAKAIEYHTYDSMGMKTCTRSYGSQAGLPGAHLVETGTGTFEVVGSFEGLHFLAGGGGLFCGIGTSTAAKQDVDITFSGIDEDGEPTDVAVSD